MRQTARSADSMDRRDIGCSEKGAGERSGFIVGREAGYALGAKRKHPIGDLHAAEGPCPAESARLGPGTWRNHVTGKPNASRELDGAGRGGAAFSAGVEGPQRSGSAQSQPS